MTARIGLSVLAIALCSACVIDWDVYEPLPVDVGGAGTGAGGAGQGGEGGGDPTTGGGGEGGDGAGGPTACGTTDMLGDDFEDGVVEGWYVTAGSGTMTLEVGGERLIAFSADEPTWSAFSTKLARDMRGRAVSIEVVEAVNPETDAETFFNVHRSAGTYAAMSQKDGELKASFAIVDDWVQLDATQYDPMLHRFWQIREEGGTLYWEYSQDGVSWDALASLQLEQLFPVDLVFVEHGAMTFTAGSIPGQARFDNLNGGEPSTEPFCSISTLSDDFDDPERAHVWVLAYETPQCSMSEKTGALVFEMTGVNDSDCGYVSATAYDLRGGSASIEVPVVAEDMPSHYAFFRVERDSVNGAEIIITGPTLHFRVEGEGILEELATVQYLPDAYRFWRIREDQGTILFETSPFGADFEVIASTKSMTFDPAAAQVVFGAGNQAPEPDAGTTEMDNLNCCPDP